MVMLGKVVSVRLLVSAAGRQCTLVVSNHEQRQEEYLSPKTVLDMPYRVFWDLDT